VDGLVGLVMADLNYESVHTELQRPTVNNAHVTTSQVGMTAMLVF